MFAAGGWLVGSEAGLRAACQGLEKLGAGQLSLVEPSGTLGRSFALRSLRWRSESLDIELQALEVGWRPVELLRARLLMNRIAAASLRVASVAGNGAPKPPESLQLPLAVEVEELVLGRIELGEYAQPQGTAASVIEALHARLSSDGELHRLSEVQARVGGLAVAGEATLAAKKPFALTAKAGIEGNAAGRTPAFDLAAEGRLEDLSLVGRVRPLAAKPGASVDGGLSARINPFALQPIRAAVLKLSGIDPAAWSEGSPQALLDLRAELQPLGEASAELGGRFVLTNRRPGAVDRKLLPFESLSADLRLAQAKLAFSDIELRLAGGGRLQGSGTLRAGELELRVAATGLDANAVHSSLAKTRLGGPLRATIGLNRQQVDSELSDPRFALHAKLAIDPLEVVVETLKLVVSHHESNRSLARKLQSKGCCSP